jgi:hypothetical protein
MMMMAITAAVIEIAKTVR